MNIKKIALTSVGCRTNQEEMTALGFSLSAGGCEVVDTVEDADIIILNSCSVTSCSEAKTRRLISALARKSPSARICVTGCLAQQKAQEIFELPQVCWVVGNGKKDSIAKIVLSEESGVFVSSMSDEKLVQPPVPMSAAVWRGRTRFPLKIQEGCNFRCSYCIVPSLRGPSRSADWRELEMRFQEAVDAGFKEVVITGTHIGQYEEKKDANLLRLLDRLTAIQGDYRIRLSSLDPRDLTEALLARIGEEPKICNHVHVSVQSFSSEVLKAMDRPYASVDALAARIKAFREKHPDAGIGGDFIVGFPGETQSQFRQTVDRIGEIGFSYGHVFRFSKRPGTPAADMDNQVNSGEKRRRSELLRETLAGLQNQFIDRVKHNTHKIIVEQESPVLGVTSNYIRVEIPLTSAAKNSWQKISLTGKKTGRGRWEAILVEE